MGVRTSSFGLLLPLPNRASRRQTLISRYFDLHYSSLDLLGRWTWERFARLCDFLKLTPEEVASLALLPHARLTFFKERNHIGGNDYMPHAMMLTLLEARVLKNFSVDVIDNPFPDMQKIPDAKE